MILRSPPSGDPYLSELARVLSAEFAGQTIEVMGSRRVGADWLIRFRAPLSTTHVQIHVQSTEAGEGGVGAYDPVDFRESAERDCRANRVQDVTIEGLQNDVAYVAFLVPVQYDAAAGRILFDGLPAEDRMSFVDTIG